jgi:hypothetical protein
MSGYEWKSLLSLGKVAAPGKRKSSSSVRPQVEQLEDRVVPSTLDLTTAGAAGVFNSAVFQQASPQPISTGALHSFVQLRTHHGRSVDQGYNTDARPLQFDATGSHRVDHALLLSNVPTVTFDGIVYREFVLAINQRNRSPLVSLDELRIYVGNSPNLRGYNPATQQLAGLSAVYDMGAGNWVKLNARLSPGGTANVLLYVPDSLLSSAGGAYVYLYSKFGVHNRANGGVEEWATPTTAAPPRNLSSLSGFVYDDLNHNGRVDPGEGFSNVLVILTGTNNLGQSIRITTKTAADGSYHFTNLEAGTYTITETPPSSFADGVNTVGSQGGSSGVNQIFNILLKGGVNGINNNFADVPLMGGGC